MGRRTLPNHLKVVKGTARKSRMRKPRKSVEKVWATPIELSEAELLRVKQYSEYLQDVGAFKSFHSTALCALVKSESIMAIAANQIKDEGDIIQVFSNGTTNISSALVAFNKGLSAYMQLASDFGATPRSSQSIAAMNDGQTAIAFPFEEKASAFRSAK